MRFFVAALLFAGVCGAQNEPGILTGTVKDFTGTFPKTVATLRLERPPYTQYSTQTDEKGEFRFEGLPSGVYGLRLYHVAFERLSIISIVISAGQQTKLPAIVLEVGSMGCGPGQLANFRSLPIPSSPGSIVGEIRTDRKASLSGAYATLYCENKSICGESKTNPKGRFEFAHVPAGNHVVSVKLAGFYAGEVRVSARDGFESSNWQVTLERCPDKACDPAQRPKPQIIICE